MARNKTNAEVKATDGPTTATEFAGTNTTVPPIGESLASVTGADTDSGSVEYADMPATMNDEEEARSLAQLEAQAKADTEAERRARGGAGVATGKNDYGIRVMLSANGSATLTVPRGVKETHVQAIREAINSVING